MGSGAAPTLLSIAIILAEHPLCQRRCYLGVESNYAHRDKIMLEVIRVRFNERTTESHEKRGQLRWGALYSLVLLLTAGLAVQMFRADVSVSTIGWCVYIIGVLAIFYQPRYGVYMTLGFSLAWDWWLSGWWPFPLNFSSKESLLYLSDSLIFSPLESFIAFTLMSWLGRMIFTRKFDIYRGPMFWPAIAFAVCVTFGLGYGLVRGGDTTIALWEARAIYYLSAMVVLTSNLFTKREHYVNLMWWAFVAIAYEGVTGSWYFFVKLNASIAGVTEITVHPAAIHHNSIFIFAAALWLYKAPFWKRFTIAAFVPFIGITYIVTQRRAAFIGLILALGLLAPFVFKQYRRLFYFLAPTAVLVGLVYMAAFWNSNSAVALPVQAVKSVVAEDSTNDTEKNSNVYRVLENFNSWYTINTAPLTGVGFGNKFLIVAPMADISFFDWWEYITHNSIIYIWMKTGIFGWVTMMYLVGKSIMNGSRAAWRMPNTELGAVTLTATLYIVMHFLFAYVDMSWTQESMVYIGVMMGIIGSIERVVDKPVELPEKRWRWQDDPEPAPGLVPHSTPTK